MINKKETINNFLTSVAKKTHELCEKQKDDYRSTLEPFEVYCEKQEHQIVEMVQSLIQNSTHVFQIIFGELTALHDQKTIELILHGIEKVYPLISQDDKFLQNQNSDETIAQRLSFNDEVLEKIYQVGQLCLERGHFVDATKVFGLLTLLDPGFYASWMMLGVSLKTDERWEKSLEAFEIAKLIDSHNPLAYFHAARCYHELGRKAESQQSLKTSLDEVKLQPEFNYLEGVIKSELSQLAA